MIASVESSTFCRSKILYEAIDGKYISTLGEENNDLKSLVNELAYTHKTYCATTVTVAVSTGPTNFKIADDLSTRSTASPHIRIQYLSPLYTLTIKNQNNITVQEQTFGGKKKYTLLTLANKNATPKEIKEFWSTQKKYTFEQLEKELNQYREAQHFLKKLIKKYNPHSVQAHSPAPPAPNAKNNSEYKIPNNAQGHLVSFETIIPLDLKKGDELTFFAKGELTNGHDQFSPNGFPDRFPRSYQKKRDDQPYGKLMVAIGNHIYPIGKDATLRVAQSGQLKLLTNMRYEDRKIKGNFAVWIFHNKKLISPKLNTGYISILKNTALQDKFYFTPDNKLIACLNKNNVVRILDQESGNELKKYQNPGENILDLMFMELDPVVVTVDKNGNIIFREVVSGKLLKKLFFNQKKLAKADFCREGHFLVAIPSSPIGMQFPKKNTEYPIFLYDLNKGLLQNGKGAYKTIPLHSSEVTDIAFSPFKDLFLSGDQSGRVIVWDTKTWQPIFDKQIKDQKINSIIFDQSSSFAWIETHTYSNTPSYVGGSSIITNRHIHRLDLKTGTFLKINKNDSLMANYLPKMRNGEALLSFSSDRKFMIIASRTGEIQLWETNKY